MLSAFSPSLLLVQRSATHPVERRIASALALLGRTTTRGGKESQRLAHTSAKGILKESASRPCLAIAPPRALQRRLLHRPSSRPSQPKATSLATQISDGLSLPRFQVPASSLRLLTSPRQFYRTLLRLIDGAKDRIFLSSLYFGKGEEELIEHIRAALDRSPNLRVHLLADSLRSTREGPFDASSSNPSTSCASLLASLARDFPDRVDVRLYRAPGLPGWLERLVGKRFVEGWGLQHMKVYGCDDDVIISGANLSTDYFTNRQDRYLLLSHRLVSDYLHSMLLLVSRFSYSLTSPAAPVTAGSAERSDLESASTLAASHAPYSLTWDGGSGLLLTETHDGTVEPADSPAGLEPPDFSRLERQWKAKAGEEVKDFTRRWREVASTSADAAAGGQRASAGEGGVMANVVPLLQMGPLGITQETEAIPLLFEHLAALTGDEGGARGGAGASSDQDEADFDDVIGRDVSSTVGALHRSPTPSTSLVDLTSGYFSLYAPYKALILSLTSLPVRIIAASPEANGFFGSKGVSRHLPAAYTWLERRFWDDARSRGRIGGPKGIELREWRREGWTYHAKGIWLRSTRSSAPHLTLIGSSNLGNRSASLDLECTLLIDVPLPDANAPDAGSKARKKQKKISLTSSEALPEEGEEEASAGGRGKEEVEPLPEQLRAEVQALREHARQVVDEAMFKREDRKVHWGVALATRLIKGML